MNLFLDAGSNSDCMASNDRLIMNNELGTFGVGHVLI
jgi:hypothetical protein